jgi:hypothetical protein
LAKQRLKKKSEEGSLTEGNMSIGAINVEAKQGMERGNVKQSFSDQWTPAVRHEDRCTAAMPTQITPHNRLLFNDKPVPESLT